jgi:hypothetical protein
MQVFFSQLVPGGAAAESGAIKVVFHDFSIIEAAF